MIEKIKTYKYLGIWVDEHLKWSHHTDYVRNKLRKSAYILNHLKYCCNKEVLLNVYYALVDSHLRYGITAWGSSRKCSQLERTQHRILKILKRAKIEKAVPTVKSLYEMSIINNFFNHKAYRVPINHSHATRRREEGRFQTMKFLNTYGKYTLPCLVPRLLNKLPVDVIQTTKVDERKRKLKIFYLNAQKELQVQ